MKRFWPILLAFMFVVTAVRAEFRAAIAVRAVTPDPLLPVSGGVGPSRAADKKQGELTVRALVLADDQTKVAFVSADFLGFPSVLGNKVRALVQGIPERTFSLAPRTRTAHRIAMASLTAKAGRTRT